VREVVYVVQDVYRQPAEYADPDRVPGLEVLGQRGVPFAVEQVHEVGQRLRLTDLLYAQDVEADGVDDPGDRPEFRAVRGLVGRPELTPGRKRFSRFRVPTIAIAPIVGPG
jgi:hypothetical protein